MIIHQDLLLSNLFLIHVSLVLQARIMSAVKKLNTGVTQNRDLIMQVSQEVARVASMYCPLGNSLSPIATPQQDSVQGIGTPFVTRCGLLGRALHGWGALHVCG